MEISLRLEQENAYSYGKKFFNMSALPGIISEALGEKPLTK